MTPRPPSPVLVVDANVLLAAALGERTASALGMAASHRVLTTSRRAAEEALGVARHLSRRARGAEEAVAGVLGLVAAAADEVTAGRTDRAAEVLRLAVPSRNGSAADAHLLALAWTLDADVWSGDRDFAGTGWPSWSTANLVAALAAS